jgi:hypothetical protein
MKDSPKSRSLLDLIPAFPVFLHSNLKLNPFVGNG